MRKSAEAKRTKVPRFLAVDLFCGAGGTTRGLIEAGGYVLAGVDKDQRCRQTYTDNNFNQSIDYANARFLNYDVFPKTDEYETGQKVELISELDTLLSYYRQKAPRVPLLFAICAPCQPFTTLSKKQLSNRRKEGRDKDRSLLTEAVEYVSRYSPEMVLSENVAGIKDPKYGNIWEDFRARLNQLGYVTGSKVVCTSQFGIPQFRKRSILIAVRGNLVRDERFADLMQTELLVPETDPNAMMMTVEDAIRHLPAVAAGESHAEIPNHRARTLSELNLKRLSSARPGESNAYMARTEFGDLSLDCHRKVNERLNDRCFSDVYTRMHPHRPSPTITTKCHSISNGRFGHYDTDQVRGISLREAAILQSFPDDYVFYPTEQIEPIARMIGNAVPPRLAQYFASYLVNSLDLPSKAGEHRA